MPLPPTILVLIENDKRTRTDLALLVGILVVLSMWTMAKLGQEFKVATKELVEETSGRRERRERGQRLLPSWSPAALRS